MFGLKKVVRVRPCAVRSAVCYACCHLSVCTPGMFEQNSLLLEVSHSWPDSSAIGRGVTDPVDEGLRERIADAMVESPGVCPPDHAVGT